MMKALFFKKSLIVGLVMALMLSILVACSGGTEETTEPATEEPTEEATGIGTGGSAIGFIFVGAKDDYGYNKAAYLGSEGVEQALTDYKVLRKENVPETAEAERVMEEMIRSGAKVIFPTSYGHLDPALEVAKRNPDVVFFHQGGLKTSENLGTYFGNIWETVYLSGVTAGKMSKSKKLGYIVSFPIPQVLMNINAFTMGARSVDPSITVSAVFTGSWCDPGLQASAANSLLDQGVDVLTQHQDCTKTIIETAERRGAMSVGYHADASDLAPNGWLTGAIWNWSKLYTEMATTAVEGKFKGSKFDARYRIGIEEGAVELAPFGSNVPDDVKSLVEEKRQGILSGSLHPFEGPVKDQTGAVKIEAGKKPTVEELETTDYLVEGVIGNIPK
jgi:basic membrane protein A